MENTVPVVELREAQKHYTMGSETVYAMNNTDLKIMPNDFLAIIGSSGSGKSTLMNIIGFMDKLSGGDMFFEGRNVTNSTNAERARLRASRIGFVFQTFNLLPRLNILENVLLPANYVRDRRPPDKNDAMSVLERVGMEHRATHKPLELSGGERQRVAIARALVTKPGIILADEPTGNLDSKNVTKMMALFKELHKSGQTLVLVTHDDKVAAFANRQVRINDGKIVEER